MVLTKSQRYQYIEHPYVSPIAADDIVVDIYIYIYIYKNIFCISNIDFKQPITIYTLA